MKKGLEFHVLVLLIVAVIGGILLLYYIYSIGISFERKTDIEACKLSIIANAKTEQASFSLLSAPITCPAEHMIIGSTDKKKVSAEIAKMMKDCWYKMGEGKIPVFGRAWIETKSSCLVCSEFTTKEDIDSSQIKEHLGTKVPGSEQTFLEYFNVLNQPKAPSADIFFVDVAEELFPDANIIGKTRPVAKPLATISKDKPYFVLFVRQQRSSIQSFFSSLTNVVSSLFEKLTGKESLQDTQTFFIVPRDKVTQLKVENTPLCQDLYWEKGGDYVR